MIDSLIHLGELSIIYLNICRNFCGKLVIAIAVKKFIVGSLDYSILAANFVALE